MGKQEITVQKENILNAYKQASKEQKTLLENMFGKDIFKPKEIPERIKTFEDACETLGNEHPLVIEYKTISGAFDITDDLYAYLELRIICAALNEGWEPTFEEDECYFFPWFRPYFDANANGDIAFVSAGSTGSYSIAAHGVPLALKTKELAEYCGKQFKDIWADFLFPRN